MTGEGLILVGGVLISGWLFAESEKLAWLDRDALFFVSERGRNLHRNGSDGSRRGCPRSRLSPSRMRTRPLRLSVSGSASGSGAEHQDVSPLAFSGLGFPLEPIFIYSGPPAPSLFLLLLLPWPSSSTPLPSLSLPPLFLPTSPSLTPPRPTSSPRISPHPTHCFLPQIPTLHPHLPQMPAETPHNTISLDTRPSHLLVSLTRVSISFSQLLLPPHRLLLSSLHLLAVKAAVLPAARLPQLTSSRMPHNPSIIPTVTAMETGARRAARLTGLP